MLLSILYGSNVVLLFGMSQALRGTPYLSIKNAMLDYFYIIPPLPRYSVYLILDPLFLN